METVFEPDELDGFVGSVHVRPLGPYLLVDLALSAGTILRHRQTRIRWKYDHLILDLIVAGSMRGTIGDAAVDLRAGDCAQVDLRGGMCLHYEEIRLTGLIIPRPLFVRLAGTGVTIEGRVFKVGSAQARALGALLDTLTAQAERLTERVATALAQAVDVLVACLAQQPLRRSGGSYSATETKPPTLAKLQRFIERHAATRDFGAETISARFGLSRTALYRIFAPVGGVAEAIRRRRAAIAVGAADPAGRNGAQYSG